MTLEHFTVGQGIVDSRPEVEEVAPRAEPTPYPTPRIGAALLTPGVDEFYEEECYVWCTLLQTDGDWEIDCDHAAEFTGSPPEWWGACIDEGDCGIGLPYLLDATSGPLYQPKVMPWALKEGLMLLQSFAVYVEKPRWYKVGWETEEWDFECDCYVIRREPPTISMRELEQSIDEVFQDRYAIARWKESVDKARWAATDRMRLNWYYGVGPRNHWAQVALVSTLYDPDEPERHGFYPIAWGRNDTGEEWLALDDLAEKVKERRPDLGVDELKKMRCMPGW